MHKSNAEQQRGVTLIISILLISGLTLIAVTLAVLSINELRASRAYLFSEPAIGAAQSGAEDALWGIKRNSTVPNCPSDQSSFDATNSNSISLNQAKDLYCRNTQIPAVFNLSPNNPYTFYLFDAKAPNSDFDLTQMVANYGANYSTLYVNWVSGTQTVNITVTRLDGTPVGTPVSPVLLSPGGSATITGLDTGEVSGQDNRMMVTLVSSGNETVNVNTNVGLPSFPTLDSTGCSGPQVSNVNCLNNSTELYNRRIQVVVPQ